jgi:hypothetical protein
VLERGLAKEPGDRHRTASELMAEAAQALGVQAAEPVARREVPGASLLVEVDPAAGEASLRLAADAEPVRLVAEGGRWRLARE